MFGLGKKKVSVHAVFSGEVVALSEVPDPVFAGGMLGEGFAVVPGEGDAIDVVAPIDGTITKVFKTLHAYALRSNVGVDVLVHVGLETVELKGEGFTALVTEGQTVHAGDPLVSVDAAVLRTKGINLITPVVFTEKKQVSDVDVTVGAAGAGDKVATVTVAK